MKREYIQGWRVGITDHPGRQELEIEGPGELHIVIRKFTTSNFYQENYIGYMDDGSFQECLICTYICPGGTSLYQEPEFLTSSYQRVELATTSSDLLIRLALKSTVTNSLTPAMKEFTRSH